MIISLWEVPCFAGDKSKPWVKKEDEMFPEYWKDGKKVELKPIYDKGREGQIVVLYHVSYRGCDVKDHPLAAYPQPTFFVIKARVPNEVNPAQVHHYILIDPQGQKITCNPSDSSYLYDAQEWGEFQEKYHEEKLERKDGRIAHGESQVALLKSILIEQGVKLITPEQAEVIQDLFGKKG
ncbi:MAG: hypothetical protein NT116_05415 [Candidatus Parcubacteria bacterium]|nr:hypothetical protein [Candidatus Parcubacteria bacterium]